MADDDHKQNYASDQQNWNYDDGRTRMQMTSSRQAWSSSSRSPAPPLMALPAFSPFGMQSIHSQAHNAAMSHHNSVFEHFNSTAARLMGSVGSSQPQNAQADRSGWSTRRIENVEEASSSDSDDGVGHTSKSRAMLTYDDREAQRQTRHQERLQRDETNARRQQENNERGMQVVREHADRVYRSNNETAQIARDVYSRTNENNKLLSSLHEQYQEERGHRRQQEQRHDAERAEMRQLGAQMDKRMRDLEDNNAKSRAKTEQAEREMKALREENSRLNRERLNDADKHRSELADLSRRHADHAGAGSSVDTAMIERLVREIQTKQLSKHDIEKVIQDRVSSQLEGIARSKDIAEASSKMQKALEAVPAGATAAQVEQAVNKELGRAVDRVADKLQPPKDRYRMLEAGTGQSQEAASTASKQKRKDDSKSIFSQRASASAREPPRITSVEVTELPDDFPDRMSQISAYERKKKHKQPSAPLSAIAEDSGPLVKASSSRRDDASRMSAKSASRGHKDDGASRMSSKSHAKPAESSSHKTLPGIEEEPTSNALVRAGGVFKKLSDAASRMSTSSKKDDKADKSDHKVRALPFVQEEQSGALVRSKKTDAPTISILQPGPGGTSAIMKGVANLSLSDDFPDRASQISSWERKKGAKSSGKIEAASRGDGASKDLARHKK